MYNPSCPIPLYIVCGMQPINLAVGPAVVTINHSHLISKDVDCLEWSLEYQNSKAFVQKKSHSVKTFRKQIT